MAAVVLGNAGAGRPYPTLQLPRTLEGLLMLRECHLRTTTLLAGCCVHARVPVDHRAHVVAAGCARCAVGHGVSAPQEVEWAGVGMITALYQIR
jgi:hypothetical protein